MWDAIWNDENTDRWDEIEIEIEPEDDDETEPEDETEVSLEDYLELI
jgi:hypothetical protein